MLIALAALALAACGDDTTTDTGSPTPTASASPGPAAPSALPTPAPTPTIAGTIIFTSDWPRLEADMNLSVVRTDGSGLRRLVHSPSLDYGAAWSSDGRWIAYTEQKALGEPCTLTVAKADGSDARRLSLGRLGGQLSSWSPDGTRLAYVNWMEPPQADIWVCDADGSHRRQLTEGTEYDMYPEWTPDGQAILFLRAKYDWDAPGDVFSVRPDGSGLTPVTNTAASSVNHAGTIVEYALSPDGRWLAVDTVSPPSIVVLPYGTSGPPKTILATDLGWGIVHMSWSPDGKALVLGQQDGIWAPPDMLVIVNADGSEVSVIPGVKGFQPEWRPE